MNISQLILELKMHQYKSELRNTKKGSKFATMYLLRTKALVNALISMGSEVIEQEYVKNILEVLMNAYDAFSTMIWTNKESYTASEIEYLLLA